MVPSAASVRGRLRRGEAALRHADHVPAGHLTPNQLTAFFTMAQRPDAAVDKLAAMYRLDGGVVASLLKYFRLH